MRAPNAIRIPEGIPAPPIDREDFVAEPSRYRKRGADLIVHKSDWRVSPFRELARVQHDIVQAQVLGIHAGTGRIVVVMRIRFEEQGTRCLSVEDATLPLHPSGRPRQPVARMGAPRLPIEFVEDALNRGVKVGLRENFEKFWL